MGSSGRLCLTFSTMVRAMSMALAVASAAVLVDPGAVLADVGHLAQEGVEAGGRRRRGGRSSRACAASRRRRRRRSSWCSAMALLHQRAGRGRSTCTCSRRRRRRRDARAGPRPRPRTSTVRAMFSPQWQTKTPMRLISRAALLRRPARPRAAALAAASSLSCCSAAARAAACSTRRAMNGSVSTKWRSRPSCGGRQAEGEADELRDEEHRHAAPRRAPSWPSGAGRGWSGTAGRRRRSPRRRAARASSMMARPRRTTEAVRLTLKAPPQHSTFMFQSTASAPQAAMTSSIEVRLLGVVVRRRPRRGAPAGSRSRRRA